MQLKFGWLRNVASVVVVALAAALSHQPVFAGQCNKPKVFYINGVLTSPAGANVTTTRLEEVISQFGGPSGLSIEAMYNPTDPLLGDAVEVANDNVMSRSALDFVWRASFLVDIVGGPGSGALFRDYLTKLIEGTDAVFRNEAFIKKIYDNLLLEVKSGNPVVVIAHSEGNFYLNEALLRLKDRLPTQNVPGVQAIGALGIGVASRFNPASLLSGPELYSYITRDDDRIIGLLDLPANISPNFKTTLPFNGGTVLNHLIASDYLGAGIMGQYKNETLVPIRKAVAQEFIKIYNATMREYPCIDSVKATPNPVGINQPTVFSAKVVSGGGAPIRNGSVAFSDGDTEICAAAIAADGTASCSPTSFASEFVDKTISAQWSHLVFRSQVEKFTLNSATSYWFGTFTPVDCQSPPDGLSWFWEVPCFNIGVVDGQYSSTFWFPRNGGNVTMESRAPATIRKVFGVEWNATDVPILSLSMPTEVLVPSSSQARYVRYSGTRLIELTVTQRTATEISGTFVVTATSGAALYITPDYPGNVAAPIQTRGTGTWSARLVLGQMPITNMNGFDLCFSDGGALNYRNLDSLVFTPGNGTYYTSLGWGSTGGTCVYGR